MAPPEARGVFETNIAGMRRWVKLARNGKRDPVNLPNIPPVNVSPTPEWAERLKGRLDGLEERRSGLSSPNERPE